MKGVNIVIQVEATQEDRSRDLKERNVITAVSVLVDKEENEVNTR